MAFIWGFGTKASDVVTEKAAECYAGPMIAVEIVMSQPFTIYTDSEVLRTALLRAVVADRNNTAAQTRAIIKRVLRSELSPLFADLTASKRKLDIPICAQRGAVHIHEALLPLIPTFKKVALDVAVSPVEKEYVRNITDSLEGEDALDSVAAMCSIVTMVAYSEMN